MSSPYEDMTAAVPPGEPGEAAHLLQSPVLLLSAGMLRGMRHQLWRKVEGT